MKIKTAELQGKALDWAVGVCEGMPPNYFDADDQAFTDDEGMLFCPSANWAQAGPIIEREGMHVDCLRRADHYRDAVWEAWPYATGTKHIQQGITPLIAAMRCYVASKLGDEVEVPNELGE